ncbi:MAG: ACP S-malonyltransferase [Isosphaeraceae bacterium]|nr:ACP S-malonyltransferase [Isosphaeraceae bacterium]
MTPSPGGPTSIEADEPGTELARGIAQTALAFRGYDVSNFGRSLELLEHPTYGPTIRSVLEEASAICAEAIHAPVDLVAHLRAQAPTDLATFPHDVAMIVAMEVAQVRLLEEFFGVPIRQAHHSFGYSIGELSALVVGETFPMDQILSVPLSLAIDCASLAPDTTMGILFTRGQAILRPEDVERLCLAVSSEGHGLIGPSAYLSPNTALVLGQGETLDRLERLMHDFLPEKVMLRRKPNHWPPLHTPLVWLRNIPNRTAIAAYKIRGGDREPTPTVISCVTGEASYVPPYCRDLLIRWTDHPQRLWDAIDATLASGVETVIHIGPTPNLIPATFSRLANNVSRQLGNGNKYINMISRGVVEGMNRLGWLARLLPHKTSLLRAPYLKNIILEDWLLEQPVARPATAVAIPSEMGTDVAPSDGTIGG